MINRINLVESTKRNLYEWYLESYDLHETKFDKCFDVRDVSSGSYDQSTSVVSLGKLDEVDEGETLPTLATAEGFTTYGKFIKFGDIITVNQEVVEDNTKSENFMRELANSLSESVHWTLESHFAKILTLGGFAAGHAFFNESIAGVLTYSPGNYIYDSKPLFVLTGDNHVSKSAANSTGYFNNLNEVLSPQTLEKALLKLIADNNRNEKDEIVDLGSNFVLVVSPQLLPAAERIVHSNFLPGSDQNDVNILRDRFTIVPWQFLNSPAATGGAATNWYVGVAKKGIRIYRRRAPSIDFYYDEDTETYKVKISMRYGKMIQNWRYWVAGKTPAA